jgi:hypothetical protein
MESESEAYLVGEVKSQISLPELAAIYAQSALEMRISRYEIQAGFGSALTSGVFWADEKE